MRGQTAHSTCNIPVNDVRLSTLFPSLCLLLYQHDSVTHSILHHSRRTLNLAVGVLNIWEETPMAHRTVLESANKL